ncbi:RTC4 family protein [Aspergillus lucknowensis]|uniref:Restriction of telomere capping protein 4 n=1 Tax=Aspergillus lucknowensis TaxID=176173 RepID=A0ABR4M396_9EURO
MVSLRARRKSSQTDAKPAELELDTDDEPLSSSEEDSGDDYGPAPRKKAREANNSKSSYSNPQKPEPATEDEPLSSSDEEDSINGDDLSDTFGATPRGSQRTGPTLEEKLAQNGGDSVKQTQFQSPSSSRKRTAQEMLGATNIKDDLFANIRRSSQDSTQVSYGSKKRKTPRSSMAESQPPSSAPQMTDSPKKDEEEEEEEDGGFRVPPEIPEFPASASSFSVPTSSAPGPEIMDSDDDSPLSSAVSCASLEIPTNNEDDVQEEYLCPMCKESVDPGLLIMFRAQPRQRIRDQQVFCDSHKQSSAEKVWKEKGYPTIDWEGFDERIQSHFDDLEKIMVPDSGSYYWNVLDTTLKSGKAKNFRLTLDGDGLEMMSCGYYGTRGSGKMLQAITSRFARKLRRLAAEDHIVKQAGVVVYAQAVLVPELAVRLIKEDMKVDDDSARQIMRESIEVGEKLNFALNDTVPVTEEKDDVHLKN